MKHFSTVAAELVQNSAEWHWWKTNVRWKVMSMVDYFRKQEEGTGEGWRLGSNNNREIGRKGVRNGLKLRGGVFNVDHKILWTQAWMCPLFRIHKGSASYISHMLINESDTVPNSIPHHGFSVNLTKAVRSKMPQVIIRTHSHSHTNKLWGFSSQITQHGLFRARPQWVTQI